MLLMLPQAGHKHHHRRNLVDTLRECESDASGRRRLCLVEFENS